MSACPTDATAGRFDEIRDKIQAVTRRVCCGVYQSGGYGAHVVVGNSLGSVVAYEALNAANLEDIHDRQADLPLLAPTQYWRSPELAQTVLGACMPAQAAP